MNCFRGSTRAARTERAYLQQNSIPHLSITWETVEKDKKQRFCKICTSQNTVGNTTGAQDVVLSEERLFIEECRSQSLLGERTGE